MERAIYPAEDAERFFRHRAGQPYRPSNGTEGDVFISAWCGDCCRNRPGEGGGCPIELSAMAFDNGEDGYPTEWRYGDDGQPVCTAFEDKHAPRPVYRCKRTADLFPTPPASSTEGEAL